MPIRLKRAYDPPASNDGLRVLVDRIWPRGITKKDASIDIWLKELAPSTELRKWFGHDPEKWTEFKKRYTKELREKTHGLEPLFERHEAGKRITLVYAAKDESHNNAVVLKDYIEKLH